MQEPHQTTKFVLGMPVVSLVGLLLPFVAIGGLTVVGFLMVSGFAIPAILGVMLLLVAGSITLASG